MYAIIYFLSYLRLLYTAIRANIISNPVEILTRNAILFSILIYERDISICYRFKVISESIRSDSASGLSIKF